jgi:hypothetical protein
MNTVTPMKRLPGKKVLGCVNPQTIGRSGGGWQASIGEVAPSYPNLICNYRLRYPNLISNLKTMRAPFLYIPQIPNIAYHRVAERMLGEAETDELSPFTGRMRRLGADRPEPM